jgi:hypothetical protein
MQPAALHHGLEAELKRREKDDAPGSANKRKATPRKRRMSAGNLAEMMRAGQKNDNTASFKQQHDGESD